MRDRTNRAVVITGASSGIGRATAMAFARRGASLVLCARGEDALNEAVGDCRRIGARAVAVPTDMRDPEAVQRLGLMAAQTFGGIGVWVNNAGGGAIGRFWEVPLEAHRATIELDLLGYVYGAYAALPHFLDQGEGVLINNSSIGGFVPTPYASAYAAAKTGVRAFSDTLRLELRPWPDIHVCTVAPYFVDTPGVAHAANYSGRRIKPGVLASPPEQIAETIVGLAEEPRREVIVGAIGKLAALQHRLAPRLTEAVVERGLSALLAWAEPGPNSEGNLSTATRGPMTIHGGWGQTPRPATVLAGLGVAAAGYLAARAFARR
jgi:short-subunit dehydrogenase